VFSGLVGVSDKKTKFKSLCLCVLCVRIFFRDVGEVNNIIFFFSVYSFFSLFSVVKGN